MLDISTFIFEKFTENGMPFVLALSIIVLMTAAFLGLKHYGKTYFKRLLHRRNLCWLIVWLIMLSVMLIFCYYHVLSRCPLFLSIALVALYVLFTVSVFFSVSKLVFFPSRYIKKYGRLRQNGFAVENKGLIDHRPWYFLDANERIQYELLKARYLHDLGDINGAYETMSGAEELPMYDEEKLECDISRAYMLIELGDIAKSRAVLNLFKETDRAAYGFFDSYISEIEGELDDAFEKAKTAESFIDNNYKNTRVKQALYNHLGRLYCFKRNPTEVFRYYKLSVEEAKKLNEVSMVNLSYNNLIGQYLINDRPKEEIRRLFDDFKKISDRNNLDAVCQQINLRVRIARHFNDKADEESVIRRGYDILKQKSKYPELAAQRVQIMHMLHSGGFDLEPVITDIENDLKYYSKLPLPQRPRLFIALAHFTIRPDVDEDRLAYIKKAALDYLSQNAIRDLDAYYDTLSGSCVNERCDIIAKKAEVFVLLGLNDKEQYQLLHDIKEIYKDNGLRLPTAQSCLNIVKYYAQQSEKGRELNSDALSEINDLLNEAVSISYTVPWSYLGDLLVDIACAYDFFNDQARACSIMKRFDDMGLTPDNCDDYRQHALCCLREQLFAREVRECRE